MNQFQIYMVEMNLLLLNISTYWIHLQIRQNKIAIRESLNTGRVFTRYIFNTFPLIDLKCLIGVAKPRDITQDQKILWHIIESNQKSTEYH